MGKAEQSDTHHRTGMSLWVALGGLDRQEAGDWVDGVSSVRPLWKLT